MARARSLKPGFFTNDELAAVAPLGRLLFAGLWTLADREGRLEDRPKKIKVEILPYDDVDVGVLLNELSARGFIHRYESGGEQFIEIVSFLKHQNPHVKEPASAIPAPGKNGSRTKPRTVRKPSENGSDRAVSITHSPFPIPDSITGLRPEVWAAWAKHRGQKLSAQAVKLQTTKLLELQRAGCDPNAVILQSIERGWSGLFEVKAQSPPNAASLRDKRAANVSELTGQARHERTIEGVAERVGGAPVPALPGDVREPRRDHVG